MEIIVAPITRENAQRDSSEWRGNENCLAARALREETGEAWSWGLDNGYRVRDGKRFATNEEGRKAIRDGIAGNPVTALFFLAAATGEPDYTADEIGPYGPPPSAPVVPWDFNEAF